MKNESPTRSFWRVLLLAVSALLASYLVLKFSGLPGKAHGFLLTGIAVVFAISDLFFWNAIKELRELEKSDALDEDLSLKIEQVKALLVQRLIAVLTFKGVALVAGGFLAWADASKPAQEIAAFVGYTAVFISLPLLLSFLTAWRQADRRLSAAILCAREKAKKEKLLSQLEKPPGNVLEPSDQLKGYTKVARSKNAD